MDKLILIPMIVSAGMLMSRDSRDVFILVFLPSLTLLPTYFNTELVGGTPELHFWSAAMLPILMAWALKNFEGYHIHWMDIVILLYILIIFIGQWTNSDYKKAQKVLFNNMMRTYLPYIMVRAFCEERKILIKMIRMMTILGAYISVLDLLEFRLFINYFDKLLRQIWPHYVVWDTGMIMIRWGFKRAFGPFSHPIVCGYFFSMIAPLSIWCYFQNHYPKKRTGQFIVVLNILGVVTSLSRAPLIGLFMGFLIIYYGWSKNKALLGVILSSFVGIILIVVVPKFIEYASVTRATATTIDQRNVAYRKEMWEAYIDVAFEQTLWGWGKFSVPKIGGMDSIDSEYLGLALVSGIFALLFYLIFLIGSLIRLFLFVRGKKYDDPWARLAWCMIAGWGSAIFTQATVYSGAQTVQYLFMLGGMGQVIILVSGKKWHSREKQLTKPAFASHGFGFAKII